MAIVILDITNSEINTTDQGCSKCDRCNERIEGLKKLGSKEYCSSCYAETAREIVEKLPNVVPQLETYK